MSKIKADDIVGCFVGEECVCFDCLTDDEKAAMTLDKVLTSDDVDGDDVYFCDRSGKRINPI